MFNRKIVWICVLFYCTVLFGACNSYMSSHFLLELSREVGLPCSTANWLLQPYNCQSHYYSNNNWLSAHWSPHKPSLLIFLSSGDSCSKKEQLTWHSKTLEIYWYLIHSRFNLLRCNSIFNQGWTINSQCILSVCHHTTHTHRHFYSCMEEEEWASQKSL